MTFVEGAIAAKAAVLNPTWGEIGREKAVEVVAAVDDVVGDGVEVGSIAGVAVFLLQREEGSM